MNENEREILIKNLIDVLKKIHSSKYPAYNWSTSIKEKVLTNFNQTIDMFNEKNHNFKVYRKI